MQNHTANQTTLAFSQKAGGVVKAKMGQERSPVAKPRDGYFLARNSAARVLISVKSLCISLQPYHKA